MPPHASFFVFASYSAPYVAGDGTVEGTVIKPTDLPVVWEFGESPNLVSVLQYAYLNR